MESALKRSSLRRLAVSLIPAPVWPETVGLLPGASVKPFRQGFGGASQICIPLATGFAMGGVRVPRQPGFGCNADPSGKCTADHPSTLGHLIIARLVPSEMYRQGLF